MYDHVDLYDSYPREVAVFAGEYAAHTEDKENTLESALAEAALLTGIEKNAGVVKLASYAPLFNRIGHSQWKPDMIWFDDHEVYLTPNYYVQMLLQTMWVMRPFL
ncbi:MAG: alpha-L-arabinofuranosidase C-terminal domain-containing protein [Agathobacter rectalis]